MKCVYCGYRATPLELVLKGLLNRDTHLCDHDHEQPTMEGRETKLPLKVMAGVVVVALLLLGMVAYKDPDAVLLKLGIDRVDHVLEQAAAKIDLGRPKTTSDMLSEEQIGVLNSLKYDRIIATMPKPIEYLDEQGRMILDYPNGMITTVNRDGTQVTKWRRGDQTQK